MSKKYLIVVSLTILVIPVSGMLLESVWYKTAPTFILFGKWFIFSAVGLRLFLAGLQQSIKPAFTARTIFHLEGTESFPIVRELGFANICFGIVGIVSLFIPQWRVVSAIASGLYYGMAGCMHLLKKPAGANEWLALWTDMIIFLLLSIYVGQTV